MRYGAKTNAIKPAISKTITVAATPKPSGNENGFSSGGLLGPVGGDGGNGDVSTNGTDGVGFGGLAVAGA